MGKPRRAAFGALLVALALGATAAPAGAAVPAGVSPANNESVAFGDAVVFAMSPEPGHTCSEYRLALDAHADEAHLGPRFQHPSCTVVVSLGSELRAARDHVWRVWRNCAGKSCNGPGKTSHRSAKRHFTLKGPIIRTTPENGATLRKAAFPIQLSMAAKIATNGFELRISASRARDALGRLADPQLTLTTTLSATVSGSHLALVSGLEPGLYYWQWIRQAPACRKSATDCPGPLLRFLLDPSGVLPELDIEAPRVRPLVARGKVGKRLKLRYSVLEDHGQGRVNVWIYRKTKARKSWKVWLGRVEPRRIFHVVWKPRKPGLYRLCTRGRDGSQNVSKKRCARVSVAPG